MSEGGLAIFGCVLTHAELVEWADGFIAQAKEKGELTDNDAVGLRVKLINAGVVPMHVYSDTEPGPLTIKHLIVDEWSEKFTEYRWPAPEVTARRLNFSHIVLIAGPPKITDHPLYFDGRPIAADFVICLWDDQDKVYRHIHCEKCCQWITDMIISKQIEWKRGTTDPRATHEAPTRLQ